MRPEDFAEKRRRLGSDHQERGDDQSDDEDEDGDEECGSETSDVDIVGDAKSYLL